MTAFNFKKLLDSRIQVLTAARQTGKTTYTMDIESWQDWGGWDDPQFNTTYWPYQHRVRPTDIMAAEAWCWRYFKGKQWRNRGTRFAFKRQKDLTFFLLKWS